ncbi:hypothetical protein BDQ12DRAFT_607294 [Crucibulum laeve]|uniref:Apple domain-containing protein n=1 Tax=Crucibulum laeve TaxID=68775 RepID=A0A5C3LZX1_9AGAR|nr:hypothetical protein BDQ12DRAFT_607294 [Crucibulum laeve]
MRFTALFAVASIAISSVAASPLSVNLDLGSLLGIDLTSSNNFGAPHAPWVPGSKPGWYFGNHPEQHRELTCLFGLICKILKLFPFALQCPVPPPPTPPPSDGYHQTFSNLTGATQAGDYLTFGLVDTVADCKAMCNSVAGCNFVNSYHDVNGKDGSTQLTCSLFSACHTSSDADNLGGQTQPDGSIDFITNSDGFCKDS